MATYNLLTDGDMEAIGTSSWPVIAGAVTKETTSPHDGTQCLRVTRNGAYQYPQAKQVVLTIGKTYRATGWARGDGTGAYARIYFGNTWTDISTTSTTWQYFDVTKTCGAGYGEGSVLLLTVAQGGVGQYAEFDNVVITPVIPDNKISCINSEYFDLGAVASGEQTLTSTPSEDSTLICVMRATSTLVEAYQNNVDWVEDIHYGAVTILRGTPTGTPEDTFHARFSAAGDNKLFQFFEFSNLNNLTSDGPLIGTDYAANHTTDQEASYNWISESGFQINLGSNTESQALLIGAESTTYQDDGDIYTTNPDNLLIAYDDTSSDNYFTVVSGLFDYDESLEFEATYSGLLISRHGIVAAYRSNPILNLSPGANFYATPYEQASATMTCVESGYVDEWKLQSVAAIDNDALETIWSSTSNDYNIGLDSQYTSISNPGTNNLITGWLWGQRDWIIPGEQDCDALIPNILDANISPLSEENFISGIGDNKDLELQQLTTKQASTHRAWIPWLNHGYYYIHDKEYYLFSDDYQSEILETDCVISGLQYHDLNYELKPTIPILIRQFNWNSSLGQYQIYKQLRKRTEFAGFIVSGEELDTFDDNDIIILENIDNIHNSEFLVESGNQYIICNNTYSEPIGSGEFFSNREYLGLSDGLTTQYHTQYSPIDLTQPFDLDVLGIGEITPTRWTRINYEDDFTISGALEYKVDDILGLVVFGSYTNENLDGYGQIPPTGSKLGIKYTKSFLVEYEPINTRDILSNDMANISPLKNITTEGFLQLSTETTDIASISLSSELEQDENNLYLIDASNEPGAIIAIVKDKNNNLVEGVNVTFTLLNEDIGYFSNLESTIIATTDINGQAKVFYYPPTSLDNLGATTTNLSVSGGTSTLYTENVFDPGTGHEAEVFLYKVMRFDPVLGMPASSGESFYEDFLADEGIDINPDSGVASADFEELRRQRLSLSEPYLVDDDDITTGAKVLVTTLGTAIHPESGIELPNIIIPLQPTSMSNVGSTEDPVLASVFDVELDEPNALADFKSYLLIAPPQIKISAAVYSERLGKTLQTNPISVKITIPDEISGLFLCDTINEIDANLLQRTRDIDEVTDGEIYTWSGEYSELSGEYTEAHGNFVDGLITTSGNESFEHWFRNTQRGNSGILGLITMPASGDASPLKIPLGWRLPSTGITVASILDRITFVQPNDNLPANYWNEIGWNEDE